MKSMSVVEYLVPSSHKRALLMLLLEHEGLTIRQLAKRLSITYSNAHREIGLLRNAGLINVLRDGMALRCSWNRGNAQAQALERLFSPDSDESDEPAVFSNLKRWHAPLSRDTNSQKQFSLEETLARALPLARRHPEVACAWPVVLAKNLPQVDFAELEGRGRRLGEKQALGFLLFLTATLLNSDSLRRKARRLEDARVKKPRDFFLMSRGDRARRLADENTPAAAKKWHFRMNLPLLSFESFFRKFVPRDEPVSMP